MAHIISPPAMTRTALLTLGLCLIGSGIAAPAGAIGARICQISVNSNGEPGNDYSLEPSMSADGRYVVFRSLATNLVPGQPMSDAIYVRDRELGTTRMLGASATAPDKGLSGVNPVISSTGRWIALWSDGRVGADGTSGVPGVYVVDRRAGDIELVSLPNRGAPGPVDATFENTLSVSRDGRYVAFATYSPLVANDTNQDSDVYIRDRLTDRTTRVSVSSAGRQGDGYSDHPSLSADGRYVAFSSSSKNLVRTDVGPYGGNVFLHDMRTGRTTLLSVSDTGAVGFGGWPSISADGRYVAFQGGPDTLVPNDTNGTSDIYVRDRLAGTTRRVSLSETGAELPRESFNPVISADGSHVAFNYVTVEPPYDGAPATLDVYVRNLNAATTTVTRSSSSYDAEVDVPYLAISASGHHVAFETNANLLPGEDNYWTDVFVRDCAT